MHWAYARLSCHKHLVRFLKWRAISVADGLISVSDKQRGLRQSGARAPVAFAATAKSCVGGQGAILCRDDARSSAKRHRRARDLCAQARAVVRWIRAKQRRDLM